MSEKISKAVSKKLEKIAMEEDYGLECRGGLDGRYNDREDFTEVSVIAIQRMLKRAYLLGKEAR